MKSKLKLDQPKFRLDFQDKDRTHSKILKLWKDSTHTKRSKDLEMLKPTKLIKKLETKQELLRRESQRKLPRLKDKLLENGSLQYQRT